MTPEKTFLIFDHNLITLDLKSSHMTFEMPRECGCVGRAYFVRNSARIELKKHNFGDNMEKCQ